MTRRTFPLIFAVAALCLVAFSTESVRAQGGGGGRGGRLFRIHQAALAAAPEVQKDLKLTEDQKTKVADLNKKLTEERQALFQSGGDFRSPEALEARNKLNAEYAKLTYEALEKSQAARLQEIYVQFNGPGVLADDAIVALLKLTDEQKSKLTSVRDENQQKFFDAFQDFGNMSPEERIAKSTELAKAADDAVVAALTEDQRKAFEEMKGAKIEIDPAQFQFRGPGGGGGGSGGGRPAADGK